MKRIIQPTLMRGHVAERAAMALLVSLLAVLFVSVLHGIQSLG